MTTINDIYIEIKNIISERNAIRPEKIRKNTFLKDLGLDSLDMLDLAVEIEKKYDIEIKDKKMWDISNFNDLLKMVIEKLGDKDGYIITN